MSVTAISVLLEIQRAGEKASKQVGGKIHRFPEAASVGDFWRQGDIYVTLLGDIPSDAAVTKTVGQIAPGTTQGSRHCLSDISAVEMFTRKNPTALDGPVLRVIREVTIEHPEHAHVVLPCGVYGITYQRSYANELRRVCD